MDLAKVNESKHTTVQKQTFNSHPKVREGRPPKASSFVSNPALMRTPWGVQLDDVSKEVTPKAETQVFKGRRDTTRGSEEECLDQWRKRIGKTSLLYSTKVHYTVGGDSTPQRHDIADTAKHHHERKIYGSSQLKLRACDPDVAKGPLEETTWSSKVPEPDISLHDRTGKKLNNKIWRGKSVLPFSAPKAFGVATRLPLRKRPVVDVTQVYDKGRMTTSNLKESSSQLPKSSLGAPPNKPSIQMVDTIEPVDLADKSSKRKYSAAIWALAKKETKRLKRENTSIQGAI